MNTEATTTPKPRPPLIDGAETVTFSKVVRIADADGKPIREGSVLVSLKDGERGVVTAIKRAGDMGGPWDQIGDIHVKTSPGCTRVSNQYSNWRHVPRAGQSYGERFLSWFHDRQAFFYNGLEDDGEKSEAEKKAISGIMALLPETVVDWECGPWPDTIEDALRFLTDHLSSLK